MQTTLTLEGFDELIKDARRAAKAVTGEVQRTLREISFAGEVHIKRDMPVDTGRARASWGHWDSSANSPDSTPADAHYEETDAGLTIVQGSNVPYIEQLNEGHSQQAPAGFIDDTWLKMEVELQKALGLIDPLDPNLNWLSQGLD